VGWFSKGIDGVKASEGTASGLNGRIPQEQNPEIILAGFTDWSKADVKSLGLFVYCIDWVCRYKS
jgi:hypothetical protein